MSDTGPHGDHRSGGGRKRTAPGAPGRGDAYPSYLRPDPLPEEQPSRAAGHVARLTVTGCRLGDSLQNLEDKAGSPPMKFPTLVEHVGPFDFAGLVGARVLDMIGALASSRSDKGETGTS